MAVVASHPILFQSVLFRRLNKLPELELQVFFHSDIGAQSYFDREFGRPIEWDVPVLGGFEHRFLGRQGGRLRYVIGTVVLAWRIIRGDFDVVALNGWGRVADWALAVSAALARVPILMRSDSNASRQTQGLRGLAKGMMLRALFRSVAGFLVAGRRNAEFYEQYQADPRKFHSVPFGIESGRFTLPSEEAAAARKAMRARLGLGDSDIIFLFVGKLVAHKRPQDLLEAIGRMPRELAAVGLFVGDGQLREDLEERARRLPAGAVKFAGFVNQAGLPILYAAADVFVLPSAREAWGLVVNEAACAGLPLLLSDQVGAAADFVELGKTGYVYRAGDVDGLTKRMEELCRDPGKRAAMRTAVQHLALRYGPDSAASGTWSAIKAVIRPARGRT